MCPRNMPAAVPLVASQSRTVLSSEADAIRVPSALIATARTKESCPRRTRSELPEATSDPHGLIPATCDQAASVRAIGDIKDISLVAPKNVLHIARGRVTEFDDTILMGHGQLLRHRR